MSLRTSTRALQQTLPRTTTKPTKPITTAHPLSRSPPQTRQFLTLPNLSAFTQAPTLQSLTATRTLPYPPSKIYSIIADVPSYPKFLPYCTSATVTEWSHPDNDPAWSRKWPEEAILEVGWKGVQEKFRSRIYCVPGKIVEAVGGASQTRLSPREIEHHSARDGADGQKHDGGHESEILTHLLTRWTVRPVGEGGQTTDVTLSIEYQFANPMYSVMAGAFADKVAGVMIEAFEKRVVSVVEGEGRTVA